jgi:hypothetical protein
MGLNRLTKTLLKYNKKLGKDFPKNTDDINLTTNCIGSILDHFIYEDRKENNNRYPFYKKNFKSTSVMTSLEKTYRYKMPDDKEKYKKTLYEILTTMQWVEYARKDIIKSTKKLIKQLDKM